MDRNSDDQRIQLQYSNNTDIIRALHLLLNITTSCRKGFNKIVQNSVGGSPMMTSASSRLFSALSVSKPIVRLIVTVVQGHLQQFSDGGHFVAMLILELLIRSKELNISPSYLVELYDRFMVYLIEDISSNLSRINLDFSKFQQMSMFVKSLIGTKPLCKLSDMDLDHISKLLIQIFVNYLPCEERSGNWQQNINMINDHGLPVCNSEVVKGLLLQGYHIPKMFIKSLSHENKIGVTMVTVSMTGDTEEIMDGNYEVMNGISAMDVVLEQIIRYCDRCKDNNVRIVFCQKVIHPRVKSHLYKHNILPLDRIGGQMLPYILKLTGAKPAANFSFSKSDVGYMHSIKQRIINKKKYLHIFNESSPVASLILTNDHEDSVQELQAVCSSALHSMERLAYSSFVLPGGGCWEIQTSFCLRNKVMFEINDLIEEYNCSKFQIMSALDVCCKSLINIAKSLLKDSEKGMTHSGFHHFWRVPKEIEEREITCSCGIYCVTSSLLVDVDDKECNKPTTVNIQGDYDKTVLQRPLITDQLDTCINAVKTAFLTANSLLTTYLYISDG